MTILAGGISHVAVAVEPYKDLEISPMYFTDISMCYKDSRYDVSAKTCGTGDRQLPVTVWAFSVKNKGKSAYLNPRLEIVIQNETGADLYSNILVITKKIEPGEIVWVAPETNEASFADYTRLALTPHTQKAFQMTFQGVTKGFAKVISAKKSQPRSMPITIPVAVDARQVPSQWITVLYKDSDGKILGGYKFANSKDEQAPYTRTLVQDYNFLKRIVFVEAYVSRR